VALPSPSWPRFHVRAVPFVRTNEISSPRGGEPGFGRRSCSSLRLKRAIHLRHRLVPDRTGGAPRNVLVVSLQTVIKVEDLRVARRT